MKTIFKAVAAILLIVQCAGCQSGTTADQPSKAEKVPDWRANLNAEIRNRLETRQNYVRQNPTIPANIAEAITGGSLVRGMTEKQVYLAWGGADRINTSTGAWGRRDQWVYVFEDYNSNREGIIDPKWYSGRYFLYFSDGILDSWQSFQ